MADRDDRADIADMTDMADMADMTDRADWADRADRADRADKAYIVCKSEIMTDWPPGPPTDSTNYKEMLSHLKKEKTTDGPPKDPIFHHQSKLSIIVVVGGK